MPVTPVTNPLLILLGLLSTGVVTAVFTGIRLPLISSDRGALIALVVLGTSMCALGMQTAVIMVVKVILAVLRRTPA